MNKCTKVTSNEQLQARDHYGETVLVFQVNKAKYSKPAIGFCLPEVPQPNSSQFWLEQGRLEPLLDVVCDPVRETLGSEDHTECGNNLP